MNLSFVALGAVGDGVAIVMLSLSQELAVLQF